MAYNETLAQRVREALEDVENVEEKKMFRGLTFMVNDKMCISVSGENLMCRINPKLHDEVMEKQGTRPMIMRGKTLEGYLYVEPEGFKTKKDFNYWIGLCLAFNKEAKPSKKRKTQ